jgi:hypothetical protein
MTQENIKKLYILFLQIKRKKKINLVFENSGVATGNIVYKKWVADSNLIPFPISINNIFRKKISSFFEKNHCGKPGSILSSSLMFLHNFAAKTDGT